MGFVFTVILLLCPWLAYAESYGWQGEPKEYPAQRLPGFPDSPQGRVGFARWIIPLLQERGLSKESAILYAAHVARETTYGANVWNFNFGNTKTGPTIRGPWMFLTDRRGERDRYRSFQSAQDGLENNLQLLRGSKIYHHAWELLTQEDPRWYGEIGLAGYFVGPRDPQNPKRSLPHNEQTISEVQRQYDGTVAHLRACFRAEQTEPLPANVLANLERRSTTQASMTSSPLPTWLVCLMAIFCIGMTGLYRGEKSAVLKLKIQRRLKQ